MIHRNSKINKNIMGTTTSISLLVFIFSDLDKENNLHLFYDYYDTRKKVHRCIEGNRLFMDTCFIT